MHIVCYFTPSNGVRYCDMRVCLSVCLSVGEHILKTMCPKFTKFTTFSMYVTSGCGLILLRRECQRGSLSTSGFVDDVIVSFNLYTEVT